MGTGQVNDRWRKNRGKDLEPQALLRRVDVSGSAGTASGKLATSERGEDQKCKPRICVVRGERKLPWRGTCHLGTFSRSGSWRR